MEDEGRPAAVSMMCVSWCSQGTCCAAMHAEPAATAGTQGPCDVTPEHSNGELNGSAKPAAEGAKKKKKNKGGVLNEILAVASSQKKGAANASCARQGPRALCSRQTHRLCQWQTCIPAASTQRASGNPTAKSARPHLQFSSVGGGCVTMLPGHGMLPQAISGLLQLARMTADGVFGLIIDSVKKSLVRCDPSTELVAPA